jgi:uncharacterized membrane protein YsdA (DUF1294 family)
MKEIIYYYIFINIFTFILFGIDKYRAIKNKYRVKESTLFSLSFIGGALGGFFGMKIFRHKTLKSSFKYGIPFLAFIEILIFIYLIR